MVNIYQRKIKDRCAPVNYEQGFSWFNQNRVRKLSFKKSENKYTGQVAGMNDATYKSEIWLDDKGEVTNYQCSCNSYKGYFGYCKHVVATLLALEHHEENRQERIMARSRQLISEILNELPGEKSLPPREVRLLPTLVFTYDEEYPEENQSSVTLSIGEERLYVVKNMRSFLEQLEKSEQITFGKKFAFQPKVHAFRGEDQAMLDLFYEVYHVGSLYEHRSARSFSYYTTSSYSDRSGQRALFNGKNIILPEILLKRWLQLMAGRSFAMELNGKSYDNVTILEQPLPMNFFLGEKEGNLYLDGQVLSAMTPLTQDGEYFFYLGSVYHLNSRQRANLMPFYHGLIKAPAHTLLISGEQQERVVSDILPRLKKAGGLTVQKDLETKIQEHPLKTEVYLDTQEGRILAEVKFLYGKRVINPFGSNEQEDQTGEDQILLLRDSEKEKNVLQYFETGGFHVRGQEVYLEEEEDIFNFVQNILPALQQEGEVFFSDSFRLVSKHPPAPSFRGRVSINEDSDLLELDFELDGIDREELAHVFYALKEKKKYYRLKNGAFLPLASDELSAMADFFDELNIKQDDFDRGHMVLPMYRSLYLDTMLQRNPRGLFKRDKAFKELVQNVREPEDLDFSLPPHLEPVLRDYQKTGFKWLKSLASYGFGGILADDMGLGKTLETISYIESEKEQHPQPALVIAPTSVIFNWQGEIGKFAPGLRTLVITGTKNERLALWESLKTNVVDVVITSYPLIRNDIHLYRDQTFSVCILDEAQYIKNAHSLTAKSVKMIKAKQYFALTGTPIENSLAELWSIFDFLMPGYFPGYQKFAQKYINPLKKAAETENGPNVLEELSRKVSPFILRRMKKDVVQELPDKIELKMVSELTREQKKVYLAYHEMIKKDIAGEIKEKGFEKSRIKILAGLTRLRQICCHPGMFLENYAGESGKLIQLKEVLEELKDGGHRTLLFSQFTSMLAIIRTHLDQEGIPYFYLDGSVPSEERLQMTEAFNQEEERDLFLISLKAGGTGLNLTGADTVIHFDPWWNPAVEDQATDRAHRIGQEKVVNVLKFITLGTIEEKIYALQQQKKNLINEVIRPGETFIAQLQEREILELLEL
ncbi:DEAD/DEAH box helicase [Dehalobacterium formicoaceticum]|uniref:DEAD/DEAH box helicase n=1 Tax=Dehalobacterium formicoaceticum TaxID=51515 RepID=A0ABT1Y6D5_9FIRM|nr:DEAD/DEAH box helicase [Dehalobacterium formicoaceticum]MCR6546438.1 DEAD/DEAH box helicase [Dehalobacterium formicoaceticum]